MIRLPFLSLGRPLRRPITDIVVVATADVDVAIDFNRGVVSAVVATAAIVAAAVMPVATVADPYTHDDARGEREEWVVGPVHIGGRRRVNVNRIVLRHIDDLGVGGFDLDNRVCHHHHLLFNRGGLHRVRDDYDHFI